MRARAGSIVAVGVLLLAVGLILSCQEQLMQAELPQTSRDDGGCCGTHSKDHTAKGRDDYWCLFQGWTGIYGGPPGVGSSPTRVCEIDEDPEDYFHWANGSQIGVRTAVPPPNAPTWFSSEVEEALIRLDWELEEGVGASIGLFHESGPFPPSQNNLLIYGHHDGISGIMIVEPENPLMDILSFWNRTNVGRCMWYVEQNEIKEFEIYLNGYAVNWKRRKDPPPYDCMSPPLADCHTGPQLKRKTCLHLRSVVYHEFLHGLGVAHPLPAGCPPCGQPRPVSCPGFHWVYGSGTDCGGYNDALRTLDIMPLTFLYGR